MFREGINNSTAAEDLQKTLKQAGKDRIDGAIGIAPRMTNIAPAKDKNLVGEPPLFISYTSRAEDYRYYMSKEKPEHVPAISLFNVQRYKYFTNYTDKNRGQSQYMSRSVDKLIQFSTFHLVLVAGIKADTLFMNEKSIERAKGSKELSIVNNAAHVCFYYKEEYVNPTMRKTDFFFLQHLCS